MVTLTPPVQRQDRVARPQDHLRAGGLDREYVITTGTGATITYNDVWHRWNQGTGSTTTGTWYNPAVWQQWNTTATTMATTIRTQVAPAMQRSAEEMAAFAERQREQRDIAQRRAEEASRRSLAEKERKAGAQERALALFLDLLTEEERASYEASEHRSVRVRGQGGTFFEMCLDSVHGNIIERDEHGCSLNVVCVAPNMFDTMEQVYMPLADGWIGQLLAIRHDLATFRQRGNTSRVRPCRRVTDPTARRIDAVLAA